MSIGTLRRATGAVVLALVASLAVSGPGSAEPSKSLAQAQAELEALEIEAETASEKFNEAEVKLAEVTRMVQRARARTDAARAELATLTDVTDQMAADAYMGGSGVDPALALLLAADASEYLEQAGAVEQVARSQNSALRRVQSRRLALAQAEAGLAQQEAAAKAVAAQMAAHRQQINDALARSERVVAQLREEDRERLAALAEQQRSAAAAAAREARDAVAQRPSRDRPSSSGGTGNSGGQSPGSSRAAIAVRYALAQVGEPYSYNAQPPNSWDCSKLTTAAWAAAGVSLTPYSLAQAQQVRRISVSELQPGDLLFYFNGARHVAMYIGGGKLVEAASPENGVQVQDAWNSWSKARFSFAGRPVG
ncbi:MAG: C40 family peptidase [Actinobacteria bacterium]|nr:C40 family peptidase [Actinomycetota bacterium]